MKVSTSPEPVFACKFVHLACEEVSAGGESLAGLHEHLISPLGWISVSEESLGHCGGDGTTLPVTSSGTTIVSPAVTRRCSTMHRPDEAARGCTSRQGGDGGAAGGARVSGSLTRTHLTGRLKAPKRE